MKISIKKIVTIVIFFIFMMQIFQSSAENEPSVEKIISSDFGTHRHLLEIQEKYSHLKNSIAHDAESKLEKMKYDIKDVRFNYTEGVVRNLAMRQPESHYIFDKAEKTRFLNGTSVLDFILNQPLNYWIYTNMSGCETWNKGLLRPWIELSVDDDGIHFIDWERWVEIDMDNNRSTGDSDGFELRARLSPEIRNIEFHRGRILPTVPPRVVPPKLVIHGGLKFEVQKLCETSFENLEVIFLKSFSYRGLNYIWTVGFGYSSIPQNFSAHITAESINVTGNITNALGNLLQNLSLTSEFVITDINGPYEVEVDSEVIDDLNIIAGYAKIENNLLTEKSFIHAFLKPYREVFPRKISIFLDSPSLNMSFNRLTLTSDERLNLDGIFYQDAENITMAIFNITGLPRRFDLRIDNMSSGNEDITLITFTSTERLESLNYDEYEYYERNLSKCKYTHVGIESLPTKFYMNGSIEFGSTEPTIIENNVRIGFVARFIDNLMIRLASKLHTMAKTIRSIPENIMNMPNEDGWLDFKIKDGSKIGKVEIWITSGNYIVSEGNFLGFYNLTKDTNYNYPRVNTSFSFRLESVGDIYIDFKERIYINASFGKNSIMKTYLIDEYNDARIYAEILNFPKNIELSVLGDDVYLDSDIGIKKLFYASKYKQLYTIINISEIPSHIAISQKNDSIKVDAPAHRSIGEIYVRITDSKLIEAGEDSHFVYINDSLGGKISMRLRNVKCIHYEKGKLNLSFEKEQKFFFRVLDKNSMTDGIALLDPLPTTLTIGSHTFISKINVNIPKISNMTSVVGFAKIAISLNELWKSMMTLSDKFGDTLTNQLSFISTAGEMEFKGDMPSVLIAHMKIGHISESPWVHGISIRSYNYRSMTHSDTKIYIRLPSYCKIMVNITNTNVSIDGKLDNFIPLYDWLVIDVKGVGERDFVMLLTSLPNKMSMEIKFGMNSTYRNGVEDINGEINFKNSRAIGDLYVSAIRTSPVITRVSLVMSGIPSEIYGKFVLKDNIYIDYEASGDVKHILLKNDVYYDGDWHGVEISVNELPTKLSVRISPPQEYDMDGSILQTLPEFSLVSTNALTDISAFIDGKAMGTRGMYSIYIVNLGMKAEGKFSSDRYIIRSMGSDYIQINSWNIPYSEDMTIEEISIKCVEIRKANIESTWLLGIYPEVNIEKIDAELLKIQMELTGKNGNINPAFVSFGFTKDNLPVVRIQQDIRVSYDMHSLRIIPMPILTWLLSTIR